MCYTQMHPEREGASRSRQAASEKSRTFLDATAFRVQVAGGFPSRLTSCSHFNLIHQLNNHPNTPDSPIALGEMQAK